MRIAGIQIPDNEKIDIGLTRVYGIGRSNVGLLIKQAKLDKDMRAKDLSKEEVSRVATVLNNFFMHSLAACSYCTISLLLPTFFELH